MPQLEFRAALSAKAQRTPELCLWASEWLLVIQEASGERKVYGSALTTNMAIKCGQVPASSFRV